MKQEVQIMPTNDPKIGNYVFGKGELKRNDKVHNYIKILNRFL